MICFLYCFCVPFYEMNKLFCKKKNIKHYGTPQLSRLVCAVKSRSVKRYFIETWILCLDRMKSTCLNGAFLVVWLQGEHSSSWEIKARVYPICKLLCLLTYKTIETVYKEQWANLFDNWADTSLHLLLLKSSLDGAK